MRRTLLLGTLGALVCAPAVHAQYVNHQHMDFGIQCLVSPFRACVTLDVSTFFEPEINRTHIHYRLSNLQGTRGFEDLPMAGLQMVRITGLRGETHWPFTSFYSSFLAGDGFAEGNAISRAWLDIGHDISYGADGLGTTGFNLDHASGLFGCFVRPQPPYQLGQDDATCGGTITYRTFTWNDRVELTNESAATLHWNFPNGGSCTTGVDCAHVTPEPVSIILLGSGLAALGAARRRRRR